MPQGDTIHYAARRIRPLVEGRVPQIAHPNPRLRGERWPERLAGRAVSRVDAHGKHLFVHFEGDLAIHSHLRMTGSWGTYGTGQRWRRAHGRAWLLDQRTIAGIGNRWKCEACFAAAIDPWRPAGEVSDEEVLAIVRAARPGMQQSALDGMQDAHRIVYGRGGRRCPRCGAPISSRGQGDDNRITYWCAGCQR